MLEKVPPEELKAVVESLTSDSLLAYQVKSEQLHHTLSSCACFSQQAEMLSKLQEKEETFISRLSKLEKTLT